jgi:hypothetical protein
MRINKGFPQPSPDGPVEKLVIEYICGDRADERDVGYVD